MESSPFNRKTDCSFSPPFGHGERLDIGTVEDHKLCPAETNSPKCMASRSLVSRGKLNSYLIEMPAVLIGATSLQQTPPREFLSMHVGYLPTSNIYSISKGVWRRNGLCILCHYLSRSHAIIEVTRKKKHSKEFHPVR